LCVAFCRVFFTRTGIHFARKRSLTKAGPQLAPLGDEYVMGDDDEIRVRSVERKGDDIVAAPEVHLGVSTRAYHDVLLAADHIAGGWRVDACAGMEVPQFL